MKQSCIEHGFIRTDMCTGCGRVQYAIDSQLTEEKKEKIRLKERSLKNACAQPWRAKFKDKPRTAKIREVLLQKYFKGEEVGEYEGASVVRVDKFTRINLKGK